MSQHITPEQALKIVRKCVQDACRKEGTYDAITVPHAALLPIFQAASAALAQPASAPNACDLIDASSYASSLGFLSGTSNWAAAMQRHLAGVLQPVSETAAVSGWMTIESAPKAGEEIVLAHPDGSMCIGWWKVRGGNIGWTDGDTYAMSWPTHWQQKPSSPTRE
jgi:hypothetical protein